MKLLSAASKLLVIMLLASAVAHADVLDTITNGAISVGDPTQTGRLSRNGIAQDWVGTETFPGVINTTTTYHYETFTVNVGVYSYIQIDFDSTSVNTFLSAYDTSYNPDSAGTPNFGFDTNWLGDAGSSGDSFGTDPLFFQVVIPQNHNLVLVLNNTGSANGGVGDQFASLTVEGFCDTDFTDGQACSPTTTTPEPASGMLLMSGLGLLGLLMTRKRIALALQQVS